MKIAYLIRLRPDLDDKVPADIDSVRIQAGDDGQYSDQDLALVADADAFVIGMEPVHEQLLAAAPSVKIVQRLGVGFETLDLAACAARKIPACNIEGVNKEAVAEHNMMLMLALSKQLLKANEHTHAHQWQQARVLTGQTFELYQKTLGIIGFGNTGSELAKRAHAFGMPLLINDVNESANAALADSLDARRVDKSTLYRESDIICICTDLNDSSRAMVDAQAFALMRPHVLFLCCARGGVLVEQALADALQNEQIAGAAVDVFEVEPIREDNVLTGLPNCLLTSHVAGVASDTTNRIWDWAHDNVRAVVERGERAQWIRNGL